MGTKKPTELWRTYSLNTASFCRVGALQLSIGASREPYIVGQNARFFESFIGMIILIYFSPRGSAHSNLDGVFFVPCTYFIS